MIHVQHVSHRVKVITLTHFHQHASLEHTQEVRRLVTLQQADDGHFAALLLLGTLLYIQNGIPSMCPQRAAPAALPEV